MPLIVCTPCQTALMDAWSLLESAFSEKAADLRRERSRYERYEEAMETAWATAGSNQPMRRMLVRLFKDLDLREPKNSEAIHTAELRLLNRCQVEKVRALRLIGKEHGIVIPDDARFWREGVDNQLVIAWGDEVPRGIPCSEQDR